MYDSWDRPRSHPILRWFRFTVALVVVGFVTYGAYYATYNPKINRKLPAGFTKTILSAEQQWQSWFSHDQVTTTKKLKAEKLLAKKTRPVRYKKGHVSHIETKNFKLDDTDYVTIQVETMGNAKTARKFMRLRGGDESDQLFVGAPSAMKIHGLDEEGNYYISAILRMGHQLVDVTIVRQLTEDEQRVALANYEQSMAAYYEDLTVQMSQIAQLQLGRLSKLQVH